MTKQCAIIFNSLDSRYKKSFTDLKNSVNFIEHLKWEAECHYHTTTVAFSPLTHLSSGPRLKSTTTSEVSSDESDSDSGFR